MEENKNIPQEASSLRTSTIDSSDEGHIDFEGIRTLNRGSLKPDPFYKRFGRFLAELFAKLILLILQVVFDVLKAVCQVIAGVFKYSWAFLKGTGRFFRDKWRMVMETDWLRRLNLIFNGVGYAKSKQWGNMAVFLLTEALFVFYMAAVGNQALYSFIHLGELTQEMIAASAHDVSIRSMVLGIMTIIIILGYCFVWNKGVQGGYDMYRIENLYAYKQAHVDAMHVLSHLEEFEEDLTKLNPFQIRSLMRKKYGYSPLSSRLISYVDFRRIPDKSPSGLIRIWLRAQDRFYAFFQKASAKISASTWHTVFAKYLLWKPKAYVSPHGMAYVQNQTSASYYRFLHTYDKYNDYVRFVRDQNSLLKVLEDPKEVLRCVYAEDEVSLKNGIAPISRSDSRAKLPVKGVASRIVGRFECSFETALEASRLALCSVKSAKLVKKRSGEEVTPEEELQAKPIPSRRSSPPSRRRTTPMSCPPWRNRGRSSPTPPCSLRCSKTGRPAS